MKHDLKITHQWKIIASVIVTLLQVIFMIMVSIFVTKTSPDTVNLGLVIFFMIHFGFPVVLTSILCFGINFLIPITWTKRQALEKSIVLTVSWTIYWILSFIMNYEGISPLEEIGFSIIGFFYFVMPSGFMLLVFVYYLCILSAVLRGPRNSPEDV